MKNKNMDVLRAFYNAEAFLREVAEHLFGDGEGQLNADAVKRFIENKIVFAGIVSPLILAAISFGVRAILFSSTNT